MFIVSVLDLIGRSIVDGVGVMLADLLAVVIMDRRRVKDKIVSLDVIDSPVLELLDIPDIVECRIVVNVV